MQRFNVLARLGATFVLLLALLTTPLFFNPTPAMAQIQTDYLAWDATANRAQNAIDAGRASNVALEELRDQLVVWRTQFQEAEAQNQNEIKTVQAQIKALGPVPEDIEESIEVSQQRTSLAERLSALQGPIKVAEISYSRADGLIRGVDQIIRERQTDALLKIGPSPVDPANWPAAWQALNDTISSLKSELVNAFAQPAQLTTLKKELPTFLILLVIGLTLLLRGRNWAERWAVSVQEKRATARRWLIGFMLSLGQMALPLAGLFLITEAIYATGLVALRSDIFLSVLPFAGFQFFAARWLGARLFSRSEKTDPPLQLNAQKRREGRLYAGLIGLSLAANTLIIVLSEFDNWTSEAIVVVLFVPLLFVAILVFRLSRLISIHASNDVLEAQERPYRTRLARGLAQALVLVAFGAPILAAIGYFKAGQAIIYPAAYSLMLIGFLVILQRLITEIYVAFTNSRESAKESLIPVVVGFVLVLASAPIFALLWGARQADITEMWTEFREGITIGETEISPAVFLTFAVVFAIGYSVTRLIQGTMKNTILPKTGIDIGGQNALVTGIGYVGIFLAAVIAINGAGIDLSSLAIVAGALSVGIGFGLQNIVSNFVSGIILLIERPISEGDWIEVGGQMGYVRDISVRSTRIETFDRTDVIVPNSDLVSGTVTNFTRGNTIGRVIVPVGVAYGSDSRVIEAILLEIAKAHPMVLANPPPYVVFQGFGADSLDFEVRAILRDVNWVLSVRSDMNHEIAKRFAEEGVEIPFAQRDIWLRNPEALHSGPRTFAGTAQAGKDALKPVQEDDIGDMSDGDRDGDSDVDGGGDGGDK